MREKQKHNTTPASTSTQPATHRGLVPEVSKLVGKIITTELVFRPLAVVKNGGGGLPQHERPGWEEGASNEPKSVPKVR